MHDNVQSSIQEFNWSGYVGLDGSGLPNGLEQSMILNHAEPIFQQLLDATLSACEEVSTGCLSLERRRDVLDAAAWLRDAVISLIRTFFKHGTGSQGPPLRT